MKTIIKAFLAIIMTTIIASCDKGNNIDDIESPSAVTSIHFADSMKQAQYTTAEDVNLSTVIARNGATWCVMVQCAKRPNVKRDVAWLRGWQLSHYKNSPDIWHIHLNIPYNEQGNDREGHIFISDDQREIMATFKQYGYKNKYQGGSSYLYHCPVINPPSPPSSGGSGDSGDSGGSGSDSGSSSKVREYVYQGSTNCYSDSGISDVLYIYKSSKNGRERASWVYSSNGLDQGATMTIYSGGKSIGGTYYGKYICPFGVCFYFNW